MVSGLDPRRRIGLGAPGDGPVALPSRVRTHAVR